MLLQEFDGLGREAAEAELSAVCASPLWARAVAAGRPYGTVDELLAVAAAVLAAQPAEEIDAALAGHPRIGERSEHASSQREQAGVARADADVLAGLAEGNRAYEERFGHVYLVCADGRPAEELLAVLRSRLDNDPATERVVLRGELARINELRLRRLVS